MINKKHLNKIIDKAVLVSFDKGKLKTETVNRLTRGFKNMNLAESIYCLSEFVKGLKRDLSKHTMTVESVIPVSSVQVSKIQKKINRLFPITYTQVTINPYILGGLKIKVGDTVLDYSVRNKLNQIGEAITNG